MCFQNLGFFKGNRKILGGAPYDMGKSRAVVMAASLTDEPPKRDSEAVSQ